MKKQYRTILSISFVMVIFLAACSVRTPVKYSTPPDTGMLKQTRVLLRDFKADPGVMSYEMSMIQCKTALRNYLQAKNIFQEIEEFTPEKIDGRTLVVDATLTDLRLVSNVTRVFIGFFAGRSHMKILVNLTDQDGNTISQQELIGAPNAIGSAVTFGNSDRNLPIYMGTLVGDFIIAESGKITNKE